MSHISPPTAQRNSCTFQHAQNPNSLTCRDFGPLFLTHDTILATTSSCCDKKSGIKLGDGGDHGTQWVRAPNILFTEGSGSRIPLLLASYGKNLSHSFTLPQKHSQRLGSLRFQFRHCIPIESSMLTARAPPRMPPTAVPPLPPVGLPLNAPAPSNYYENGRMYGGFRKGKYMFPNDEVIWGRFGVVL